MTKKLPALRADSSAIEFECKVDSDLAILRVERTRRGKLCVTIIEGFSDPSLVLSKAKTTALVNWLAATQGVEPT